MTFKKRQYLIIWIFFIVYALTFLPHFGVMNSLNWIGPFPLPLAWVLFLNVINTFIIFLIYKKYFVPFSRRMEKAELKGEE
ncbi:hypothetical protein HUG15_08995 [Salicibibacter cibarius]|uniref:DUF485 domain-containing protein n=1 Tax=Salicibibacter cibarius TaxID=2743000 RepID=A0A7T6Z2D0_9BACI|nr:hypothetical protein [Salicibibacter cibarius]QQK75685.1 hypothetical protein HUG15_08995 [Salicibibacter cibarius]